ncbi:MAG: LolA family protein [Candidatus Sulfotelmatobacter sp.]
MKRLSLLLLLAIATSSGRAWAQSAKAADPGALDAVLKKMDAVAANFTTAQANFEWETYQKVIDEIIGVDKGVIYYRKSGKQVEMMAEVKETGASASSMKAEPKFVLLTGGKIRLYQPKLDQVTEYDLGKNHSEFESYIVLGFGASGQDLQKNFEVAYMGPETIEGVKTAKLQLIPKSENVKKTYSQIVLWIDPDRGVSVQQQLFQPQGDYRLAKYSQIKMHEKIGDDVFKLKTTSKTQTVTPRG